MAKKLVAAFLMCVVLVAAVHAQDAGSKSDYKACYEQCNKPCTDEGKGYTYCEMKCDTECGAKELEAALDKLKA